MSRYRCPDCKSDQIQVTVKGWANLDQSDPDNIQTESADADHDWDDDSSMRCISCGHIATVREFQAITRTHADAFLDDLVQVYRRHDMSLSHEDEHGAFRIERYSPQNENWLRGAMLREP